MDIINLRILVAESDVRVRVRRRVVTVDVKRRQVRVVSVVATTEPAKRKITAHGSQDSHISTISQHRYYHSRFCMLT